MGLDPTVVRVAFVVTALASGFGLAAYVVGWLALPVRAGEETPAGASIIGRARSDTQGLALVVGLVPVLVVALLAASVLRTPWLGSVAWPGLISVAGLVLVWRNGTDADRAPIRQLGAPLARFGAGTHGTWRRAALRAAVGVVLGTVGVGLIAGGQERAVVRPIGGVALVLGAILVVFGPWWANLARELAQERRARTRAEERSELASRVHDSVLQTLALVQRHADDPQRVRSLVRAQERELRAWLFEGRAPGGFDADVSTLGDALRQVQSDLEASHGARVELVVVGDAPLDEGVGALVAAAREATVNAAKWSGAQVVSVSPEAAADQVAVFVRDRGKGFDREAVAADRKGLAESIEGRMARVGGQARVVSIPGSGTEVELVVPVARHAGHRRSDGWA